MKNSRLLKRRTFALFILIAGLLLSNLGGTHRAWFGTTLSATPVDTSGGAQLAVVHAFAAGGPLNPGAAPIEATDGNFYGSTQNGGPFDRGVIYTMTPAGEVTVLHVFAGGPYDGSNPSSALVQGTDGNLYGTTTSGGAFDGGTVFAITPEGDLTLIHSFAGGPTDGAFPQAGLIQGTDGNFYGTTFTGGAFGQGTIFTFSTCDPTIILLHSFSGGLNDGSYAFGGLLQATDGNFYGTTTYGGTFGRGTVFTITPAGVFTRLHSFVGGLPEGSYPYAALMEAADGYFYGTTNGGGTYDRGTAFKILPDGTFSQLHAFRGEPDDGANPFTGALVQTTDGSLHGITQQGGLSDQGTTFTIAQDGTFTVRHAFSGGSTDAGRPASGLFRAADGVLYGASYSGGAFGQGTVFAIAADGAVSVLFSFNGGGTDGTRPDAALTLATDGNFYGTTGSGGRYGFGTIFKMTPAGTVTALHSFDSGSSEGSANSTLLQATDGNFYGTNGFSGPSGLGQIFRITAAGTFTVLHSFTGNTTDGANPYSSLIQALDGNLYGTTGSGGASDLGTVFTITPDNGTVTILHAFDGETEGANPIAGLFQASDGNFYGSTQSGGEFGLGTLFAITPGGTVTVLHAFVGSSDDGAYPAVSVIQGVDGNFYGTTTSGGTSNQGTAFTMTPAGGFTVLHHFVGGAYDGSYPRGSLIQASDGNFYGTTQTGGALDSGTVFMMTPAGMLTVLHTFVGEPTGGAQPRAALVPGADGNFYGTTSNGGAFGQGLAFRLSIPLTAKITSPTNGATGVDLTLPMQWTTVLNAQAYYLYLGTTPGAKDVVNSGELHQTSYLALGVPGGQTVFARLWTKAGGVWRFNDSSFTTSAAAVPVAATLTSPIDGTTDVDLTVPIQWTTVLNAQAYYLYLGTSLGAKDLVNSGELQPTSYLAGTVPASQLVFARIWTKVGGVWRFADSSFTTSAVAVPVITTLTSPADGATGVDMMSPIQWTTVLNAQAYYLYLGTTPGAKDLVNTGELHQTSYLASGGQTGQRVFARIWVKVGGIWRFSDSSFTTAEPT